MKASRIHEFGDPEVLQLEEIPAPEPAADQVLVKVHAAGVNPVDGKIRSGKFKRFTPELPAILGRDFSGVVTKVGSAVTGLKAGDEVFGMSDYARGAYAEYCLVLPSETARKPSSVGHLQAGCIGVAGQTAWQALFRCGQLQAGQRVLVHGAAGGVGHFAVQLAALYGAEVIASVSAPDMNFAVSLGAAQVIDYKARPFEEVVHGMDLVLDLVGGATCRRSWQVLKPGGILVSTLGQPEPPASAPAGAHGEEVIVQCSQSEMGEMASKAASGAMRIELDRIYPLAEAWQAHEHLENEHSRGKTVLGIVC